jgi:hypothetical protein
LPVEEHRYLMMQVGSSLVVRIGLFLIWLTATACAASAQSGMPPFGSYPTFGSSGGTEVLRHRGPTGQPCLEVSAFSRPHTIDPNLFDHVITVANQCAQQISIKVCYYQSQDCISVDIPGGEHKEAILGMMPSMKDFRFDFREKF